MDHMATGNPFTDTKRRPHTEGPFYASEVSLANRNSGILLEALRHDVTPVGMHYLLNHFDVPYVESGDWQVEVVGRVQRPAKVSLEDIKRLPARTLRVTLECAGNGRGVMTPRYPSMPWGHEAVEHCGMDRHAAAACARARGLGRGCGRRSPSSAPIAASTAGRSTPMAAA